jgi:hypothetical protein
LLLLLAVLPSLLMELHLSLAWLIILVLLLAKTLLLLFEYVKENPYYV